MQDIYPKLSVIVCVYNLEKYIEKCLLSIEQQTYGNLEILVIDDGSKDNSGKICDRLAQEYVNIHVVHQENKGLVGARIAGVELASGEYITYVDGDDWLDNDLYMTAYNESNGFDADVTCFGITVHGKDDCVVSLENSNIDKKFFVGEEVKNELLPMMFCDEGGFSQRISPTVYSKIYRADVIGRNQKNVHLNVTLGEDAVCSYICISEAEKVCILNRLCGYHYRNTPNSMSKAADTKYYEKILFFANNVNDVLNYKNLECMRVQYESYILFLYLRKIEQDLLELKNHRFLKRVVGTETFKTAINSLPITERNVSTKEKIIIFLLKHNLLFVAWVLKRGNMMFRKV